MSDQSLLATHQVEILRGDLIAKLDELRRRAVHVKQTLSQPWLVAGAVAAAALVLVLLRPRDDRREGLIRATARAGLAAAARAVVWNALAHPRRRGVAD